MADGFAGNVLLKGLEGAGAMMMRELRDAARSSRRAKLGALLLLPALQGMRDRIDPETYGGAYLLGVRGISVIAHGNSSRRAIATPSWWPRGAPSTAIVDRMAQRRRRRRSGIPLAGRRSCQYSPAGSGVGDGRDCEHES